MKKAVFFDRDGVINKERGDYTFKVDDFIINEGVLESMKKFQNKGYLIFVITNQGGIAKNRYTFDDVEKVHQFFLDECKKENIKIQNIYFCPHHNEIENCLCRKPGSLMLEKAIARYNIVVSHSYLIGDSERDVIAAEKVGVKGFLVESNENISEICNSILLANA